MKGFPSHQCLIGSLDTLVQLAGVAVVALVAVQELMDVVVEEQWRCHLKNHLKHLNGCLVSSDYGNWPWKVFIIC